MMRFFKAFRFRTQLTIVVCILIILYAGSSINLLLIALGFLQYLPGMFLNLSVLVSFAVASFVLTILVGIYHLISMIIIDKRKSDHQE